MTYDIFINDLGVSIKMYILITSFTVRKKMPLQDD